MNNLGAIASRLASTPEAEDQVVLLSASLLEISAEERETAARMLADPPRARRIRLSALRNLVRDALGPDLYELSADFVGDATETIALLWQPTRKANRAPAPSEVMEGLATLGPTGLLPAVQAWMDASDAEGRLLIARLVTGSFRSPAPRHVLQEAFENAGVTFQPKQQVSTAEGATQPDLFGQRVANGQGSITAALLYAHRQPARALPLMCTVGVWTNGALTPVCKLPVPDADKVISQFVSAHATKRFGPTTQVAHSSEAALLLEVAFDGVAASRRHKAGLVLLSPRITGISASKDIDSVSSLEDLTRRLPEFGPRG